MHAVSGSYAAPIIIPVSAPWYQHLYTGVKRVEGKKDSPKWANINVGTYVDIQLDGSTEHFRAVVTAIRTYKGRDPLVEYLTVEGVSQVLPGVTSLTRGIVTYLQWSTVEEIEKYGMKAIEISRIA